MSTAVWPNPVAVPPVGPTSGTRGIWNKYSCIDAWEGLPSGKGAVAYRGIPKDVTYTLASEYCTSWTSTELYDGVNWPLIHDSPVAPSVLINHEVNSGPWAKQEKERNAAARQVENVK